MPNPAVGSELIFGLGRETTFGVPAGSLTYYKAILPANANLVNSENPGGEVNPSGFPEPGVPGPIQGPIDVGLRFASSHLLLPAESIGIKWTKSTLDAGPPTIYGYEGVPDIDHFVSLWGLIALPGVDKQRFFGTLLSGLNLAIGDNTPLGLRLVGQRAHGTRFGPATAAGGNTGSYTAGPILRGVLADPSAGGVIWVKVTDNDTLEWKTERIASGPTYPGAAVAAYFDADGNADWQNFQDEAAIDFGWTAENKDPSDIIWPGDAAAHLAAIDIDDVWSFDLNWADPTPTYTATQRYTSAHSRLRWRYVGESTWNLIRFLTGSINLGWPIHVGRGSGSKYPYRLSRQGVVQPIITAVKEFDDLEFVRAAESHRRIEAELLFEGGQISGDGALRDSILYTFPSMKVMSARPVQNQNIVNETLTLTAESNADGDPPVTINVQTTVNFTPTA